LLRRYIFSIIAAIALISTTVGCNVLNNAHKGPVIDYFRTITNCDGTDVDYGAMISGISGTIIVVFKTENVNQAFDADLTLTSNTIPLASQPSIHPLVSFKVIQQDTGKASGKIQAAITVYPNCKGEGVYLFNMVITDGHDRYAALQGGIEQKQTPLTGGSASCKCAYQCGGCSIWATHDERCQCNCKLFGEKCVTT
jgi:hypothetical protein